MIIDRRTFIQISAPFVATGAALAILPSQLRGASSPYSAVGKQDMKHLAFKIREWDRRNDSARDSSKASLVGSVTDDSNGDEIFISINQSWRTAWR
ncbi:MAG: hypothetical protein WCA34_14170 [Candidatus Acidiferrales bacterium]